MRVAGPVQPSPKPLIEVQMTEISTFGCVCEHKQLLTLAVRLALYSFPAMSALVQPFPQFSAATVAPFESPPLLRLDHQTTDRHRLVSLVLKGLLPAAFALAAAQRLRLHNANNNIKLRCKVPSAVTFAKQRWAFQPDIPGFIAEKVEKTMVFNLVQECN